MDHKKFHITHILVIISFILLITVIITGFIQFKGLQQQMIILQKQIIISDTNNKMNNDNKVTDKKTPAKISKVEKRDMVRDPEQPVTEGALFDIKTMPFTLEYNKNWKFVAAGEDIEIGDLEISAGKKEIKFISMEYEKQLELLSQQQGTDAPDYSIRVNYFEDKTLEEVINDYLKEYQPEDFVGPKKGKIGVFDVSEYELHVLSITGLIFVKFENDVILFVSGPDQIHEVERMIETMKKKQQ